MENCIFNFVWLHNFFNDNFHSETYDGMCMKYFYVVGILTLRSKWKYEQIEKIISTLPGSSLIKCKDNLVAKIFTTHLL